jgi:hypothetical protein
MDSSLGDDADGRRNEDQKGDLGDSAASEDREASEEVLIASNPAFVTPERKGLQPNGTIETDRRTDKNKTSTAGKFVGPSICDSKDDHEGIDAVMQVLLSDEAQPIGRFASSTGEAGAVSKTGSTTIDPTLPGDNGIEAGLPGDNERVKNVAGMLPSNEDLEARPVTSVGLSTGELETDAKLEPFKMETIHPSSVAVALCAACGAAGEELCVACLRAVDMIRADPYIPEYNAMLAWNPYERRRDVPGGAITEHRNPFAEDVSCVPEARQVATGDVAGLGDGIPAVVFLQGVSNEELDLSQGTLDDGKSWVDEARDQPEGGIVTPKRPKLASAVNSVQ